VVKSDLGNRTIGINLSLQIGLCNILQGVLIGLLFQQVGLRGDFQHNNLLLSRGWFLVSMYTIIHGFLDLSMVKYSGRLRGNEITAI
jgi:hypothetical protein